MPKKAFLGTFLKFLTKKSRFFGALPPPPPPLKISIYWRQRRLKKNLGVRQPNMDIKKYFKGGPFGWAGGRIPEGGGASAPSLNPLLIECFILFKYFLYLSTYLEIK